MCGIVGYVGARNAADVILDGLQRLEYGGDHSAGLAVGAGGALTIRRHPGKVEVLARMLAEHPVSGPIGIGHTRWATHGRPSEANAHPHADCSGRLAVVHNGIIENYRSLTERLIAHGHRFRSETDTEVIAHLVESELKTGADLVSAVRATVSQLRGAYAVPILAASRPAGIVAAKHAAAAVLAASATC